MSDALELTVDKFSFRIAPDRLYTPEGVWARLEGDRLRVGLSDFLQQRSGDVAFAEVKPAGTRLATDEEFAVIETIKVNISLGSPVAGAVIETNPEMDTAPELINQDPYEGGWLAVIQPHQWEIDRGRLLEAPAYLEHIRMQVDAERGLP